MSNHRTETIKSAVELKSEEELSFVLFCLDGLAKKLNLPTPEIYQKSKESGLLQDYIIEKYDILHTLGKEYLLDDLSGLMKENNLL